MSNTWTPIVVGGNAAAFEQAIDAVAAATNDIPTEPGDWGAPLLCHYLGLARGSQQLKDRSAEYLIRSIDSLQTSLLPAAMLYSGVPGVGWLAAHLDTSSGEAQDDDNFREFDDAFLRFTNNALRYGYDLISGAVGIGIYFIERLPNEKAVEGLHQIVEELTRRAEVKDTGLTWLTPPNMLPAWQREIAPRGYYNVGVAHGVPGIVGLLAEMCRAQILDNAGKEVLRAACQWVIEQRLADGTYPAWVTPDHEPQSGRVAWCYGELGIAVTLLLAARSLKDARIEASALEIAAFSAKRRDAERTLDACVCHGAAGNGHLFNRLYQSTRLEHFKEAALFWFDRALSMRRPSGGVAGFFAWKPGLPDRPNKEGWHADATFLTGATGIALTLLAATSAVAPQWDRVLLADVEPC